MVDQAGIFKICPDKASVLCSAAANSLTNGELDAARESLLKALHYRPSSALAFKLLGDVYSAHGDDQSAHQCYRNQLPADLCENTGEVVVVAESDRVPVFAPEETLAPAPGRVAERCAFEATTLTSNACFIDTVSQATLWHDDLNTLACDHTGAVLPSHNVGCTELAHMIKAEHKPVVVVGRSILAGAKGAHNFYHWTTDIIPKLMLLEVAGFQLKNTDTIIVSRASAPYARQLLALFNIHPDQVIETESSSPFIQAEEIVLPYLHNKMGYGMGRWLPERMREKMGVGDVAPGNRKLFVNRRPDTAAGRTLENSAAAEVFFRNRGYEVVYPEVLSVKEQARLFSSAMVIAGVHGAGLANIMYCAPGTKVIEFYGAHIAPCYWLISALAGFDYYQHPCQTTNANGANSHAAGLTLPLDEIGSLLDKAE